MTCESFSEARELALACRVSVREDVSGRGLTTYKIGGLIPVVVEASSCEDVSRVVLWCRQAHRSYRVLGAGSNVLLPDGGIDDIIILQRGSYSRIIEQVGQENDFRVGASVSLMALSRSLSSQGYSGLEFAGGIPAHVGGAVFMNAGAHGRDISSLLKKVEGINEAGEIVTLSSSDLSPHYREGGLPKGFIVTSVVVSLVSSSASVTGAARASFLRERKLRQPLTFPSAGSVFRNPSSSLFAGRLIEECGLKGTRHGGAEISHLHGNWIVNHTGHASQNDVVSLMELCESKVQTRFNMALVREVQVW
jgi:UDP-N-acetylmuramate dehydrogenase